MLFVSDLLKYPHEELEAKCVEKLDSPQGKASLDKWFFPTMPNENLGAKDSCRAFYDLFGSMSKAPSFFKAIQYTLILLLELDYNSKETGIFNECIDSYVRQDPKQYCFNQVINPEYFNLWNELAVDSECTSAATQVVLDCSDN